MIISQSLLIRQGELPTLEAGADGRDFKQSTTLGILRRFKKTERASDLPSGIGDIKAIHSNAIEFRAGALAAQGRGIGLLVALFALFFSPFVVLAVSGFLVTQFHDPAGLWFSAVLLAILGVVVLVACWPAVIAGLNADLFGPSDIPILFDRLHRKVYRVVLDQPRPRFGPDNSFFNGPWWPSTVKLRALELDWNCVEAQHRAQLTGTSAAIGREHSLVFNVYQRPLAQDSEAQLVDAFTLGNPQVLSEDMVPMLWEHVRRYMEENGPPLAPGDELADPWRPKTLWQSLGAVGPFGQRLGWWYRHMPAITILLLVTCPVTLPFFMFWGVCNWISHKTMRTVTWPDEVLRAVGPQVQ
jgi:hypothetical protein